MNFLLLAQAKLDKAQIVAFLEKAPSWLWVTIGAVAAAVIVLAVTVVIVRRRRQTKKGAARAITAGALVAVWKSFLTQIPREFRRYVLHFQSFVVLGESASGKSLLTSKYTDWKGQAAQFYPSFTADSLLQIYLGSRAIIQEVPSALLADTTPKARTALVRLWSKTFRKRPPIAVISLSATALREATPDSLRAQAQLLRGKINILSRIANAPIRTRIVLTHMDQVEGYLAFSEFVEKNEIPHEIRLDQNAQGLGLATCLEPYERYLSLALTTLPAKQYLQLLTFLAKAPGTFQNLGTLLTTLRESDPRSYEPEVSELFLTSHTSGSPSAVSNPFETSQTAHSQAIENAIMSRHRWITGSIAAAGLAWLLAGFFVERQLLVQASDALVRFETSNNPHLAAETELALSHLEKNDESRFARFLPTYRSGVAESQRARFASIVREQYLLKKDKYKSELLSSQNAPESALFLLGLVYASKEDELGDLILNSGRIGEWAAALKLPEDAVAAYVRASDRPWIGSVDVPDLPYERSVLEETEVNTWSAFCSEIGDYLKQSRTINTEALATLQRNALKHRGGLAAAHRRRTTQDVYAVLARDPRFPKDKFQHYMSDLTLPKWLVEQESALYRLLDMIRDSDLRIPALEQQTLFELVYSLRGIAAAKEGQGEAGGVASVGSGAAAPVANAMAVASAGGTIHIELPKSQTIEGHSIDTATWRRLLDAAKARALVERFVRDNQRAGAQIFFSANASFPEVTLRPSTTSEFLFPGKCSVPGEYTKAAFEREVLPQIAQFERAIDQLDLEREVHENLVELVSAAADQYAGEYERQWRRYFDSWQIAADSLGGLKIILGQMKLPASRFQGFVKTVAENTTIESNPSPYLRSMQERMAAFRPLAQILATGGPKAPPELENYRSILARIASDLEGNQLQAPESTAAADPKKQTFDFEALLTPVGKLSLNIIRETRDSYLRLTAQWLHDAGIPQAWQAPFLQPIQELDRLGRKDMEAIVAKSWQTRVRSQIVPLMEKFPWNPRSPHAATPADMEEALHPVTGSFWTSWRAFIGPICVEEAGKWKPIAALDANFAWPQDAFRVTNHLVVATKTLFDKDGVPRPLALTVKAEPLPKPIPERPATVVSFMGSGKSSVFGFNQRPTWLTLSVDWAQREGAQVGAQLGRPDGVGEKLSRTLSEPEGYWAFYRLLTKQPQEEKDAASFTLFGTASEPAPVVPPIVVRFSFKEDPWILFNVPTFERSDADASK